MNTVPEPIAIVGTACRFPGRADSPAKLWDLLSSPQDVASQIPSDRLNLDRFHGDHQGTIRTKEGYFLQQRIDHFDTQFFGISPAEAEAMDPQHRILLEVVYEALESAGIPMERVQSSNTAVYIGQMCRDYQVMTGCDFKAMPTYHATGTAPSSTANRISYFFNWHGPSIVVDTACSSSLVALHLAVQQLRTGASTMALAGGTNLILDPFLYISMSNLGMLSPGGRSRMWDTDADGFARGEGVAAVLLKPLRLALRDGDHIECLVRETGINQDGRTQGITTPSATAQAELIRDTYRRAGLSPTPQTCQYFEAHGTGTLVGDPQEAEAIDCAFFSMDDDSQMTSSRQKLWVGSVKTVMGHSEGCAGLAGLLKASAAVQHAEIPPNLHFRSPNPKIAPFLQHLQVPTSIQPWPVLPDGVPRRASVNSFGFGGTNSHAIVESFTEHPPKEPWKTGDSPNVLPIVLSAASKTSLAELVRRYHTYLEAHGDISLGALTYSLSCRRSALPYKISFAPSSVGDLIMRIGNMSDDDVGSRSMNGQASILGVFTGQGAQWPHMGGKLIQASRKAQRRLDNLDQTLKELPSQDRPGWTIRGMLENCSDAERINDPVCSQTLCTAIQLVLVDLLAAANIHLGAVVGHSSGEIVAAYAAGYLRDIDCIRIAYYRGLHVSRSRGPSQKKGSMIAVSMAFEDASILCESAQFIGRLVVAAWNSPTSVTLSGDEDAVAEVHAICERDKRFARRLRVGTAYHSHHMVPCSKLYVQSMTDCQIETQPETVSSTQPIWFSSVDQHGQRVTPSEALQCSYWVDNMTQTVCLEPAVARAMRECGPFHLAIEIGPHPALQLPVTEILRGDLDTSPPYLGLLTRSQDDCRSFAAAMGSIWASLGPANISLPNLAQSIHEDGSGQVCIPIKDLPAYPWEHDSSFWAESRTARRARLDQTPFHSLMGYFMVEGPEGEWRWHNYLKPKEMPWLLDHRLQGKAVFPATGYILQAVEAGRQLAGDRVPQQIEIRDLEITRTTIVDDVWGTETLLSVCDVQDQDGLLTAAFTSYSLPGRYIGKMDCCASCTIEIAFQDNGHMCQNKVCGDGIESGLVEVDMMQFQEVLEAIGYGYHGLFRNLSAARRHKNYVEASLSPPSQLASSENDWLFHPATLDGAIQSVFAAYSAPGDGTFRELLIPTRLGSIKINPSQCESMMKDGAHVTSLINDTNNNRVVADISIGNLQGDPMISIEDVEFSFLVTDSGRASQSDRQLFFHTVLGVEEPNGTMAIQALPEPETSVHQKAIDCQRMAFYYIRQLDEQSASQTETGRKLASHHQALLKFCGYVVQRVRNNTYPHVKPEWLEDSESMINSIAIKYQEDIDFCIARAAGVNLPAVIRGENTILEVLDHDGMLDRWYHEGMSVDRANLATAQIMKQISHRFPDIHILEIGAGTGGTTQETLPQLGKGFSWYTFTDISSTFIGRAQEKFEKYRSRMSFSKLDIAQDPASQGFEEGAYDVVSASNVLHATPQLETTLHNVRRLLRPGSYLVLTEIIGEGPLHLSLTVGGLPGWWVGQEDGRQYAPTVSLERWDSLLRASGFSGVDTHTPIVNPTVSTTSVIVSQAVDEQMSGLRRPLLCPDHVLITNLVIVGGATLRTKKLTDEILEILTSRSSNVLHCSSLEQLSERDVPQPCTVLNMTDLDTPVLDNPSLARWESLKSMLFAGHEVLWVTSGVEAESPQAAMSLGLTRSLAHERPGLRIQTLDIDHEDGPGVGRVIANRLLQFKLYKGPHACRMSDVLWSSEPEVFLKGDQIYIPRLKQACGPNQRLNSAHRPITAQVSPAKAPLELRWDDTTNHGYVLQPATIDDVDGQCALRILASSIFALSIPTGKSFLHIGRTVEDDVACLVLSQTLSSIVSAPQSLVWQIPPEKSMSLDQYLTLIIAFLLSEKLGATVSAGTTALVHEPSATLATMLKHQAFKRGFDIIFSTEQPRTGNGWVTLSGKLSTSALRKTNVFVDMSPKPLSKRTKAILDSHLPEYCQWIPSSWFVSKQAFVVSDRTGHGNVRNLLESASQEVHGLFDEMRDQVTDIDIREVGQVSGGIQPSQPLSIIHWDSLKVPISIQPADSNLRFKSDRTYWLAGLSSDLAWAICDWMALHGARYIVITSRNPVLPAEWKQTHLGQGTVIEAISSDITNFRALEVTYQHICAEYPPIVGVFNGAMVMREQTFDLMDLEKFSAVLSPKVQGTMNLDRLFHGQVLDFFVSLSSTIATTGNMGQTAYAAANMFMKSLMRQRQQRGLAGFAVDISTVTEVGFVHRHLLTGEMSNRKIQRLLKMAGPMSIQELQQLLAEAIRAGQPKTLDTHADLVCGLPILSDMESFYEILLGNVRFLHLVQGPDAGNNASEQRVILPDGSKDTLHIKAKLAALESSASCPSSLKDQTRDMIKTALVLKTSRTLQRTQDSIEGDQPVVELGLDSLSVVDIRNWLREELDLDLSVFQILAGMSVNNIVQEAMHTRDFMSDSGSSTQETNSAGIQESSTSESITTPKDPCPEPKPFIEQKLDHQDDKQSDALLFDREEDMSSNQESIWLSGALTNNPRKYNITMLYQIIGKNLQVSRFARAVKSVVHRHPMLRTAFFQDPITSRLRQGQLARPRTVWEHVYVTGKEELMPLYEQESAHIWQIDRGEVFKTTLVSDSSSDQHWVIFAYHHIVIDGMSWRAILRDLDHAYQQRPFEIGPGDYMDYSVAECQAFKLPYASYQKALDFWTDVLQPLPEEMPLLPWARVRSHQVTDNDKCHVVSRKIGANLVQRVTQVSGKLHGTPAHFYFTTMQVVLARILQIREFCIGIVDANRRDERFVDTVGFFVKELPIRVQVDQSESFAQILKRCTKMILGALEHGHVPLELILDHLNVPRTPAHTPLFQIVFNHRMGEYFDIPLGNNKLQYVDSAQVSSPYEILLDVTHSAADCILHLTYRDYLYEACDMDMFLELYIHALESFAADASCPVEKHTLHSSESMTQVIRLGSGPAVDHLWPSTITKRFEEIVNHHAADVAVIDRERSYSYSHLARRVHHLAAMMSARGIQPGARVAILCQPSMDVVMAILAVLRLGAAYVPLDISLPVARHEAMITDCQPEMLCYHHATKERVADAWKGNAMCLLDLSSCSAEARISVCGAQEDGDLPACVLYTSGSTGTPKGIALAHRSIINTIAASSEPFECVGATILQQSSLGFDMSLFQIFCALLNGGKLVIAPYRARGDPRAISGLMQAESVTTTIATPSEYQLLLEYHADILRQCPAWRFACAGGEALTGALKRKFQQLDGPRLVDSYGPAETTMFVTWRAVGLDVEESMSNVGWPIANNTVSVLDVHGRPMPIGLAGEICVSGAGVALGYLHDSLNKGKFIEGVQFEGDHKMYYRTGDRGRLLADGSLVFLDRMGTDSTVKVRGLRMDLDEIAACIMNAAPDRISLAVVSVRGDQADNQFLVAHVTLHQSVEGATGEQLDPQSLIELLPLPQYMRPARIVPLRKFPTTANNKVDRRALEALPLPPLKESGAPLTLAEMGLQLIWREVLQHTRTTEPSCDFFSVGGNSTLLVRLQAAIKTSMGCSIQLADLYRAATLRGMAKLVMKCQNATIEEDTEVDIDWDQEIMGPDVGLDVTAPSWTPKQQDLHVLMTGGTGYVGTAILQALINDARVARIHCLAVSPPSDSQQAQEVSVVQSAKVVTYPGSLRDSTLGISTAQVAQMQSQIDMIIHAGAEGTCVNRYSSLREPNVHSTRWLASIGISSAIPLHYISFGRVIGLSGKTSFPPASLAQYRPSGQPRDGYLASKWASECIVEASARHAGLRGFIHRPCLMTGDRAPSTDGVNALVRYSRMLRAVPSLNILNGFLDIRDVTEVGADIAQACLALQTPTQDREKDEPAFRHYSTGIPIPVGDFRAWMEAQVGEAVTEVPYAEWASMAVDQGMDPALVRFIQWEIDMGEPILFPYMGETK